MPVLNSEYLLGVADVGGELMRLGINSVAAGDTQQLRDVIAFLREMNSASELLRMTGQQQWLKDLRGKFDVLLGSLKKVRSCVETHENFNASRCRSSGRNMR